MTCASRYAISISGIGKRFVLGQCQGTHRTLREALMEGAKSLGKRKSPEDNFLWALKDVSFDVLQGEAIAIIGSNGGGKSTLLKILSRVMEPTTGRAVVRGRIGSLLEVGTGFHPELTGRENVFLNGSVLGMRRREIIQKFDQIIAFAGIERFVDTQVKFYSSGMYVRLAFAVAVHLDPDILVIDEVLAVGDLNFQRRCLDKMQQIARSGKTVLFVSHQLSAVRSLCQRGILLVNGEVGKVGSINEVVECYLHSTRSTGSSRIWSLDSRPGNDCLRVGAILFRDAQGRPIEAISSLERATIEVHYEILRSSGILGFSLSFLTDDGITAFVTQCTFSENSASPGWYQAACEVPADLLNARRYHISLTGLIGQWNENFTMDRVISIEVVADHASGEDHFAGFFGAVRPKLRWTTSTGSQLFV